jgi:hypothetical protein
MGRPDPERICASIVERSNLSTRMSVHPFHAANDLQQVVGEPLGHCRGLVHLLQLLPRSQEPESYACDGSGDWVHVWTVGKLLA